MWMEENPEWMWTGEYSTQDDNSTIKVAKTSFPRVKDSKLVAIYELTVYNPYMAESTANAWCDSNPQWTYTGNFEKLTHHDGSIIQV
jgi:hypothetical protein